MGFFEFILILVVLIVVVDAGTKLLVPLSRRLADLLATMVEERRGVRPRDETRVLPDPVIEELEGRLADLEDRLRFLEELKAPERRKVLETPRSRGEDESF